MINTVNMSVFLFAWEIFTSSGFSEITNQLLVHSRELLYFISSPLCAQSFNINFGFEMLFMISEIFHLVDWGGSHRQSTAGV